MQFTLYADGGARGNPGPAGSGAVVFDSQGKRVVEVSDFIGVATNNVAEYEAIVRGLTAQAALSLAYTLQLQGNSIPQRYITFDASARA